MGLETIAAVASVASSIKGFVDARGAEKEQKKANKLREAAAEQEAMLTKADAAEKARLTLRNSQIMRATQLSKYLKSGVTLDGSPMLVQQDTKDRAQEDINAINTNAEYSSNSILLRGKAHDPVKRADIFGTAADVLQGGVKIKKTLGE